VYICIKLLVSKTHRASLILIFFVYIYITKRRCLGLVLDESQLQRIDLRDTYTSDKSRKVGSTPSV